MEKQPVLNHSENRTFRILQRGIVGTDFYICPKIGLREPIRASRKEFTSVLSSDERRMLSRGHLDFLITRGIRQPLFAVEFDGPRHETLTQIARDAVKNRLCFKAGLPLLRVRSGALEEHDKVSLLEYIAYLALSWEQCKTRLDSDYKRVLQGDANHENVTDPQTAFSIAHPFPATELLCNQLWEEHRLDWGIAGHHSSGELIVESARQAQARFRVLHLSQRASVAEETTIEPRFGSRTNPM